MYAARTTSRYFAAIRENVSRESVVTSIKNDPGRMLAIASVSTSHCWRGPEGGKTASASADQSFCRVEASAPSAANAILLSRMAEPSQANDALLGVETSASEGSLAKPGKSAASSGRQSSGMFSGGTRHIRTGTPASFRSTTIVVDVSSASRKGIFPVHKARTATEEIGASIHRVTLSVSSPSAEYATYFCSPLERSTHCGPS